MTRSCPHCGRLIADGALACPHCGESLDVTQRISLGDVSWCPECGALVPRGSERCPKCGHELVKKVTARPRRRMNLPTIEPEEVEARRESDETGFLTRIESAIPGDDPEDSPGALHDRMPHTRVFVFAAILALVVVGGTALAITHPWDPQATQTKAKTPADVSMSGFPGEVDSLSGQDKKDGEQGGSSTTQTTLDLLQATHEKLGELAEDVDESEQSLRDLVAGSGSGDAEDGLEAARSISISVSNAIASLDQLTYSGDEYGEDIDNLQTLGSWLRNRCDALTSAWELAEGASDPSSVSDSVVSKLNGSRDYDRLFSENYDAWAPAKGEDEP